MTVSDIAGLVDTGRFSELFIGELGWDNPSDPRPVHYRHGDDGEALVAVPICSKRGVVVYHCKAIPREDVLDGLDRAIARRSVERLLVLTDGTNQQWRWPEPRKSGGTRYVTHDHVVGAPNSPLFQRLSAVRFTLAEEDRLTVLTVRERVRASFNAEEVTARFYTEFRENQQKLDEEIEGLPSNEERTWYSSLLLNRLMFIYFMQRKGFLNDDLNYLRTSLTAVQAAQGPDRFYEYYRDFLIPLFHEGLGGEDRQFSDQRIASIIGDVPYINGGIFALHMLEEAYAIRVPDDAFVHIFDFFDRYRWHLDERPTGRPEEINPEVLGYIFEQYVNQKAQGAYYTREDVTGYMSGTVIAPCFITRLEKETGRAPWDLLPAEPARYIPEGLQHGVRRDLPEDVASAPLDDRGVLDQLGDPELALPGERWREVVDRREHYAMMLAQTSSGSVTSADAAVSLNLDVLAIALDWITALEEPCEVAAAFHILTSLKILDPTCGSGAFLFAALDILSELYETTLDRAEKLLANGADTPSEDLRALHDELARHASRPYFVLKTAVLSNLYGLDLMVEATEIARLRLFLALVARLNDRRELEPLPDLDMNIRPGNLLVGCTSFADAERRFEGNLLALESLADLSLDVDAAGQLYRSFVDAQRVGARAAVVDDLKRRIRGLNDELRSKLDVLYSPQQKQDGAFTSWRATHQPFHWFAEFPEAMAGGGFDAVIGNPPYIAKSKVPYRYRGFATDNARDIFAPCMERAASLTCPQGGFSMIVPISFQFSDDFESARGVVARLLPQRWVSTYSRTLRLSSRPASVFGLA